MIIMQPGLYPEITAGSDRIKVTIARKLGLLSNCNCAPLCVSHAFFRML